MGKRERWDGGGRERGKEGKREGEERKGGGREEGGRKGTVYLTLHCRHQNDSASRSTAMRTILILP